eukprot:TRINITY_DN2273_c0_g4_i1.p1 TRINITY_DN2273_c0_g4~~TRINITY_DN2273_c0_g4_i1.p1  ORF type:complete len:862 (-),score=212.89 TRINITY_DN2273_c0_g4_i1:50-2635(-)
MEMFEFFAFLLEVFAFIGVVSIAAFLFILLCKNHRRTVKDLYPLFAPIRVTIAASWATFYSSWKLVLCVFFQIDRIVRAALKGHNLISDLNADKSRIEKQIEEHKNRISDLKQAVHDLEQSLNERNFSIDEKDQIIEAKKSEIDSLIEKNKRFRNQLADLLNELAHEKLMKEAYRSEYNRENEYWVVWRQQRQQNLNAERQAGYESAMKIANGIDRELKLVKIQLSKVIQENGQFNFAHQRLTNQIAAMNRGKFQMEQMHNSAMTAAKQELQRTLTEVEQQKDEIQHITQQRNELTNEVAAMNKEKLQMEKEHKSAITAVKRELNRARTEVSRQKNKVQHFTEKRDGLVNEVARLTSEKNQMAANAFEWKVKATYYQEFTVYQQKWQEALNTAQKTALSEVSQQMALIAKQRDDALNENEMSKRRIADLEARLERNQRPSCFPTNTTAIQNKQVVISANNNSAVQRKALPLQNQGAVPSNVESTRKEHTTTPSQPDSDTITTPAAYPMNGKAKDATSSASTRSMEKTASDAIPSTASTVKVTLKTSTTTTTVPEKQSLFPKISDLPSIAKNLLSKQAKKTTQVLSASTASSKITTPANTVNNNNNNTSSSSTHLAEKTATSTSTAAEEASQPPTIGSASEKKIVFAKRQSKATVAPSTNNSTSRLGIRSATTPSNTQTEKTALLEQPKKKTFVPSSSTSTIPTNNIHNNNNNNISNLGSNAPSTPNSNSTKPFAFTAPAPISNNTTQTAATPIFNNVNVPNTTTEDIPMSVDNTASNTTNNVAHATAPIYNNIQSCEFITHSISNLPPIANTFSNNSAFVASPVPTVPTPNSLPTTINPHSENNTKQKQISGRRGPRRKLF